MHPALAWMRSSMLGLLIIALGFGLTLTGCTDDDEMEVGEEEVMNEGMGMDEEATTSIPALEGEPMEYMGQTVTVDGEVEEVWDVSTFTLTGGLFTGNLPVIVPPNVASGMTISEDDELQVTGTVQAFVVTELETEYGFDLLPEVEAEIEEREPVLVAETITPMDMEGGMQNMNGMQNENEMDGMDGGNQMNSDDGM